jgi:proteic killer suppression protein
VIKTFSHKGLEKFYETGSTAGIQPGHRKKLRLQLAALDTAQNIEDMDIPGFRLHSLKGNRKDHWAIDVSGNWRMTFRFADGNAYLINYEDYH